MSSIDKDKNIVSIGIEYDDLAYYYTGSQE
jgi:hypothetical protein